MAEEPEVIQRELEDTRHALAEKLEQISEKISGTVETVTETVSNVTETVSNMSEAVEGTVQNVAKAVSGTVESVKETVSTVGEKASETVEAVKQAFNLPEQVRQHPCLWFCGSVAVGFLGGKLLLPGRASRTEEAVSFARGAGYAATDEEAHGAPPKAGNGRHRAAAKAARARRSPTLPKLLEQFGPEIDKLKGLALGALFGVARDMVARSLPESLKEQVTHLFNDFTEKAGGQTIQGEILAEPGRESEHAKGEHDESDNSSPAEMDRPLGAVERQGAKTVGQAHRR